LVLQCILGLGQKNLKVGGAGGAVTRTPFPHDKHGQDAGSDSEVHRNHQQTSIEGILPPENTKFGDQEDDRSKASGDCGCNKPGSDDLCYALLVPTPGNAIAADGCNTGPDNATDDTVPMRS
jgi:hypothetical protein